ncbi:cytochrome P450 family protein [Murinocardiopsis flavida]|uniref:cytochrome P450 family protein n=1 Tax=Murinocardiopsis flavida TaxID=645275 RepID=UPI000D0E3392|nr:cytochrome P450 [Murinocardiopsis flavida]
MVDGLEVWALTRDTDLRAALTDRRFRRNWRHWTALTSGEVPEDHPVAAMVHLDNMLTADGDEHRRLRGLISQAFTRARIAALRPAVEAIARGLLDGLAAEPGPVDLKAHYAYPLSMAVFGALFGIGEADHDRIRQMVTVAFSTAPPEQVRAMRAEVTAYLDELIATKQDEPGEDVVSALLRAREQGDRLGDAELRDTLWLLLTAGFETTASALVNAIAALLDRPDQMTAVQGGLLELPAVVEESLRQASSVAALPFLFAAEDITIAGRTIATGEPVLLAYLAANRDTAHYGRDAEEFDATRRRPRHLGLGHGPHICLGAALARLELQIGLAALVARFPDLRRTKAPPPVASVFIHSPAGLPVHLTATARVETGSTP